MPQRKVIAVRLDPDLVDELDSYIGEIPGTRSSIARWCIRAGLEELKRKVKGNGSKR